jgi:hypothetical protein
VTYQACTHIAKRLQILLRRTDARVATKAGAYFSGLSSVTFTLVHATEIDVGGDDEQSEGDGDWAAPVWRSIADPGFTRR